jgi:hypothetical protein
MFLSMTLARAIHADRVREIQRSVAARRLLAPTIDPVPVARPAVAARPVVVERRPNPGGVADIAA